MSDLFLTNPSNTKKSHLLTQNKNKYFDYKEQVTKELCNRGIPFHKCEVVVIDFRAWLMECFIKKLTPSQTAKEIEPEVRRVYAF